MDGQSSTSVLVAGERDAGVRLDLFVAAHLSGVSRSKVQKGIDDGSVAVNEKPARKNALLKKGDRVAVDEQALRRHAGGGDAVAQDIAVEVVYEDEHVAAVNKPAGMVVHPGSGNREGTLVNALLYHMPHLSRGSASDRPGIVHRLDKDTSGVLLVAKTDESHDAFARLFSTRKIEKTYIGVCIGIQPARHGRIQASVGRSRWDPKKQSVREGGKPSMTEYWLVAHRCGTSLVRFRPHTGRTHQIRLHCSHAGFPLVCDTAYGTGSREVLRLAPLDRPFAHRIVKCFSRHALHARRLRFVHPFTGAEVTVEAPFPHDFVEAIGLFGEIGEL